MIHKKDINRRFPVWAFLLFLISIPVITWSQPRGHSFPDAEKWAKRFENPERDEWQKPELVLKTMNLDSNMIIADIGSATGYFPVRFAKVVPDGHVYGIDIEPDMVDYLNDRAKKEGFPNLTSILGAPDDPQIPRPADRIFLCNTYHHIHDRTDYFRHLQQYLNPNGNIVIVDFRMGDVPHGPPDRHKLPPDSVIAEMKTSGYTLADSVSTLPYQYMLIFKSVLDK